MAVFGFRLLVLDNNQVLNKIKIAIRILSVMKGAYISMTKLKNYTAYINKLTGK